MNRDKLRMILRIAATVNVLFEMLHSTIEHFHVAKARASISNNRILARNIESQTV